jgi:hypothetical protein
MGYTDRAGIDSRANSALCRIELILADRATAPAVRLALIAEVMAGEPILTDTGSPAAFTVRAELEAYHRNREYADQRAHDVTWMTAAERAEHDRAGATLLRELRNARGIDA